MSTALIKLKVATIKQSLMAGHSVVLTAKEIASLSDGYEVTLSTLTNQLLGYQTVSKALYEAFREAGIGYSTNTRTHDVSCFFLSETPRFIACAKPEPNGYVGVVDTWSDDAAVYVFIHPNHLKNVLAPLNMGTNI